MRIVFQTTHDMENHSLFVHNECCEKGVVF